MNRIYYGGMTTLSGGNLSILDEQGNIWITPSAVDKGNLKPEDICCIKPDGTVIGLHQPSSELPFHRAIYEKRPNVRSIVHAHPPALVAFSIARQIPDTNIIPQAKRVCGTVGYALYAVPGSELLGQNIAAAFEEGYDVVLLENHGMASAGESLLEAFQRLETLDFCARIQMHAQGLGAFTTLTDEDIKKFDHRDNMLDEFTAEHHSSQERESREQIVRIVHRAYERQLMISTEGVVSIRVDENNFLITPTGQDRRTIDNQDIVLINNGMREKGKLPSRSANLHQAIYNEHPEINCIITAQSPFATTYAISDQSFDTKTIPESYVLLRDVPKLSYGKQFAHVEEIAAILSDKHPVLLIQNDCILTTGSNLLQAFDRIEVAEFTARSLMDARKIGSLVPIDDQQIQELEQKFLN